MIRPLMFASLFAAGLMAASCATAGPQDAAQLGRTYLAEGEAVAAAKSFAEQQRMAPYDPVALNNLGVAKAAAGDYLTALDLIARAQKLAPYRTDIQDNLSNLREWVKTYAAPQDDTLLADANVPQEPPVLWPQQQQQARAQQPESQPPAAAERRARRSTSRSCKKPPCK
jgi:Flp pilus assembly protein TadD